jgi:quercetin dioxygenase-like cupin family protein
MGIKVFDITILQFHSTIANYFNTFTSVIIPIGSLKYTVMIINSVKETNAHENPHQVDVRRLYDHDNAQVMHITLQSGQSLKPHITPVDVFFYILEGEVNVLVGDETVTVEKDSLVESPKDIIHSLANNSGSIARILVVKAPKPMAKAKML